MEFSSDKKLAISAQNAKRTLRNFPSSPFPSTSNKMAHVSTEKESKKNKTSRALPLMPTHDSDTSFEGDLYDFNNNSVDDPSYLPSPCESPSLSEHGSSNSAGNNNVQERQAVTTSNESPSRSVVQGKTRNRKRRPDPESWKKNVRKSLCQSGKSYISTRGKSVSPRALKPKDCSKCPRKCNFHFDEGARLHLHKTFWGELKGTESQRAYISSLIEEVPKKSQRTSAEHSRRSNTKLFFLIKNGVKIQVCQGFFIATFDVSETFVRNIVKNRSDCNIVAEGKRGRHSPGNKRPEDARKFIKTHINSFPKVPSHYCRKSTNYEYLPCDLNLQKMYECYVHKCQEENMLPEKLWLYRKIFNNDFYLKFHTPRKDMCDKCFQFQKSNENEKQELIHDYEQHIKRKVCAREFHDKSKQDAIAGNIQFIEFDLEGVRYCPSTNARAIFYKRRLAVYNLTVYNVATKEATCYMWHEGMAGRGSDEVASCLFMYLKEHCNGKPFVLMSDTCGGQNRNVNISAMLLYSVQTLDIPQIDHCFFEPGHSMMECDSVHALIEKKSKNIDIFDPTGWYTAVRMSSKQSKYKVIEIGLDDIFSFKTVSSALIKNRKVDTEGNNVNWLKISWLHYKKNDTKNIYFKYNKDEEFKVFQVMRRLSRPFELPKLIRSFTIPKHIKTEKYKDLLDLCNKGIIPSQYHHFYKSLTTDDNNVDSDD